MSKAKKNSTKPSNRNVPIRELRLMLMELHKAEAFYEAAFDAYGEAEKAADPHLPSPPAKREMPSHIDEAFQNITVGQIAVLPEDHPYTVWDRETSPAYEAAKAAYSAEKTRIRDLYGCARAEKRLDVATNRLNGITFKIIDAKASSIEALAIKMSAIRLASMTDANLNELTGLVATIDALTASARKKGGC